MDDGYIDNAWMISYPRPSGVTMLVDFCVCVVWIWTGRLVGGNGVTWSRRWIDAGWIDKAWMISYPRPRGCEYVS